MFEAESIPQGLILIYSPNEGFIFLIPMHTCTCISISIHVHVDFLILRKSKKRVDWLVGWLVGIYIDLPFIPKSPDFGILLTM